jgi:hypothetical protein
MFDILHPRRKSEKKQRYKYPVYRLDDRPRQVTPSMLEDMDADELWKELKRVYKSKD